MNQPLAFDGCVLISRWRFHRCRFSVGCGLAHINPVAYCSPWGIVLFVGEANEWPLLSSLFVVLLHVLGVLVAGRLDWNGLPFLYQRPKAESARRFRTVVSNDF